VSCSAGIDTPGCHLLSIATLDDTSYIDQAGAIEARRQGCQFMVTVSMDKIVFDQPVFVGDLVSFWTETLRIGNTSITTKVVVEAIRGNDLARRVLVTEAKVVYVNVGEDRKPRRFAVRRRSE